MPVFPGQEQYGQTADIQAGMNFHQQVVMISAKALWLWVALKQVQSQRVIKRCLLGKLPVSETVGKRSLGRCWAEDLRDLRWEAALYSVSDLWCMCLFCILYLFHLQHQVSGLVLYGLVTPCYEYLTNLWQHEWLFTLADLIHVSKMLHLSKVRTFKCYHPYKHSMSMRHLSTCPLMLSPWRVILCGWTLVLECHLGQRSRWRMLDSYTWSTMKERWEFPSGDCFVPMTSC